MIMQDSAEGCDLLKFNYLCGRITNWGMYAYAIELVVICSNLTTFVVESPTQPLYQSEGA